ncbi:hypothetical protein RchiOBHm_Chr7g0184681 [Rosa chinensis]|uniref:Uncharacterized protein n=1 Tax=Rosa chinensis TaxID=74649 RepID=A0A2P6P3H0_ROSCH|nr:hypothetical protein RchiOBHm_Chr7g0184681 [Rosa chinensis]
MKMETNTGGEASKKRSCKGLCGFLKEGKGRLYILRRLLFTSRNCFLSLSRFNALHQCSTIN